MPTQPSCRMLPVLAILQSPFWSPLRSRCRDSFHGRDWYWMRGRHPLAMRWKTPSTVCLASLSLIPLLVLLPSLPRRLRIRDSNGLLRSLDAGLVNFDNTVNIDYEGILPSPGTVISGSIRKEAVTSVAPNSPSSLSIASSRLATTVISVVLSLFLTT